MSKVSPHAEVVPPTPLHTTHPLPCRLETAVGILYAVATAIGTVIYLIILAPNVSNDHLWQNMNTTGVQTFLGDLYNTKVTTGADGRLDLFASSAAIRKDYSLPTTFIDVRPAAARAVLLSRLSPADAIKVMRAVPFSESIQTLSQPCWADFNRSYAMARTARHQVLCAERRLGNAAFYLEALFRNLQPNDLITSTYLAAIQTSVFDYIETTRGGTAWVQAMKVPPCQPMSDEVTLWRAYGLEYFQNSFQNYYLEGTQESITLVNALGMRQSITVSSITATNRPKPTWSSAVAYTGFWNDIDGCEWLQASLIRAAPNNFQLVFNASWESWDFYIWGTFSTNGTAVIRSSLGPLTSFDVFVVPPPPSLLTLVAAFHDQLHASLLINAQTYLILKEPTIDTTPGAWTQPGAVFYGGNPLCPYGIAKPFVQASFGYYDDCGDQIQHTIQLTRDGVLFALMASVIQPKELASVCHLSSQPGLCLQTLIPAMDVLDRVVGFADLSDQRTQATQDVKAINATFVQWATIDGTNLALHQPMVSTNHDPWSFIGWMTMYEWVMGQREVYTFEGDWDIWTLMSRHQEFIPLAANTVQLPQSACRYLWLACTYVSLVFLSVLLLVVVYSATIGNSDIHSYNLLFCNRLVGGAWIGRPFLFLRGIAAILVLATSPVALNNYGGLAKLDFAPRPLLHVFLLAGNVVWVNYVLHDILLPFSKPYTTVYAPLSSLVTWLVVMAIELTIPYNARATIGRNCTILSFSRGLECRNGDIHIGDVNRVGLLAFVVVASVPLAYILARGLVNQKIGPRLKPLDVASFHLTGISETFLNASGRLNHLDIVACILTGLLPCGPFIFDIKTWTMFSIPRICQNIYKFPSATINVQLAASAIARRQLNRNKIGRSLTKLRALGVVGLLYMCGSVVGSFLYFFASQSYFTNDFLWLGFSDTNTQTFLCNWFNSQLQLTNGTSPFRIDNTAFGDFATTNNVTQLNVISSALYPILIQDEANSLTNVVRGLRTMDSCKLPWIATAYCFADFDKVWQMAFSEERQQRCFQNDINNGAVYLETILRNTNWLSLEVCWGSTLDSSIFSAIQNTNTGVEWIKSMVAPNNLSVIGEIKAWQAKGITRFTTMWQNYKSLGITESFLISTYAGLTYPLTLKQSNSSFHISGATAFKMYSPLANYLSYAFANNSVLSGKSLIRTAPAFAFTNLTTQNEMLVDGTLHSPLNVAFSIFSSTIGTFGVIDVNRVPPPRALCDFYRDLRVLILSVISSSDVIQGEFWTVYTQYFLLPQPSAWDPPALMWGGDINCGLNFGGNTTFPLQYFSSNGLCGNYYWDYMKPLTQNIWMAILAMGSNTPPNATRVSLRDTSHQINVYRAISTGLVMINKYMSLKEISQFDTSSKAVKHIIQDILKLELIQYLSVDGDTYFLSRVNIFSPRELDFEFFAWLYLFEWVEGKREVISLHGAMDTMTTLSTTKPLVQQLTDSIEIPLNVGRFFNGCIFYVTSVLFGVGCLVTMYILTNFGYVDGFNVMAFNYVAGQVWIGRPLILLRGLTSIALLSTSQLKLVTPRAALTSYFQSPPRDILTTLLSSSEICWLVYAIVDTFSIVTQEYTSRYSFPSVVVVGVSVAIWSFAAPTTHSVELSRQCTVVAVDFDISCVSGIVRIGDFTRFCGLIGLAWGGGFVTYIVVRVVRKRPPRFPPLSPLLYSAAKTKFEYTTHVNWEHEGVYYLDRASAAMTGILTLTYGELDYIADIKTWRVYELSLPHRSVKSMPPQFRHALPLDSVSKDAYSVHESNISMGL
ncbi:Aste57867_19937 [Aphanomyces stellatus]|uniref:Aste57867_19937 protein n=1 Tax=Aphanomyces stellatus TaxID=120398 RepID=A0A485LDT4_9STRA|nr:hypothetical protein As57867_019871 [Aphanomyces stellatus]VFT96634.1 Aste57867_19937 [Aphanomyces stellatus]